MSLPSSTRSPWAIPADWPAPDPDAGRLSERLVDQLRLEIDAAGGSISFAHYMERILYSPGLGYYSAGLAKFGPDGDFVTAPELSPLFARCVARTCASVLKQVGGGDILELGAGSGRLAAELLAELEFLGALPERYLILERSGELRARQAETLQAQVPHVLARITWLDRLPRAGLHGLILANEVIDALPVQRFVLHGEALWELRVAWQTDHFAWREAQVPDERLTTAVSSLGIGTHGGQEYLSEINLELKPWLTAVAEILHDGALLLIDYGYPRHEYYHPQRAGGTLMCHYRQRAHVDPLLLPGLQDVTAHVDFTALAEAAEAARLKVTGFTTQTHFLMDTDIERMLGELDSSAGAVYYEQARQAKVLMLPGEMGERFKAMLLGKGLHQTPPGFRTQDFRNRL